MNWVKICIPVFSRHCFHYEFHCDWSKLHQIIWYSLKCIITNDFLSPIYTVLASISVVLSMDVDLHSSCLHKNCLYYYMMKTITLYFMYNLYTLFYDFFPSTMSFVGSTTHLVSVFPLVFRVVSKTFIIILPMSKKSCFWIWFLRIQ